MDMEFGIEAKCISYGVSSVVKLMPIVFSHYSLPPRLTMTNLINLP